MSLVLQVQKGLNNARHVVLFSSLSSSPLHWTQNFEDDSFKRRTAPTTIPLNQNARLDVGYSMDVPFLRSSRDGWRIEKSKRHEEESEATCLSLQ